MAEKGTTSGIGFCGLLGIVFIVLRLCHVIEWRWVWVLSPIWGSIALALLCVIVYVIIQLAEAKKAKKRYEELRKR